MTKRNLWIILLLLTIIVWSTLALLFYFAVPKLTPIDPAKDVFDQIDWQLWHGTLHAKNGDNVTISCAVNDQTIISGTFRVTNETQGLTP